LVDKGLVDGEVGVRCKSDRIITIKVVVGLKILNMVSGYALQIGAAEHIKKQFRQDLDMVIQDVPQCEKLFIGIDFNSHVGVEADGHDTAHRGFGCGERNNGGVSILEFAVAYGMLVITSILKKKENHLVTFKSGFIKTKIDYFMTKANNRRLCVRRCQLNI